MWNVKLFMEHGLLPKEMSSAIITESLTSWDLKCKDTDFLLLRSPELGRGGFSRASSRVGALAVLRSVLITQVLAATPPRHLWIQEEKLCLSSWLSPLESGEKIFTGHPQQPSQFFPLSRTGSQECSQMSHRRWEQDSCDKGRLVEINPLSQRGLLSSQPASSTKSLAEKKEVDNYCVGSK